MGGLVGGGGGCGWELGVVLRGRGVVVTGVKRNLFQLKAETLN